jgi:hypothetical protein
VERQIASRRLPHFSLYDFIISHPIKQKIVPLSGFISRAFKYT